MAIPHAIHPFPEAGTGAAWPAFLARLHLVLRTVRTRRLLARLDDRALRDIGLSRAEALAEAGRAPWDLGPPRRR